MRHGISIWIDVPLDMITRGLVEDRSELPTSEVLRSESYAYIKSSSLELYSVGPMNMSLSAVAAAICSI